MKNKNIFNWNKKGDEKLLFIRAKPKCFTLSKQSNDSSTSGATKWSKKGDEKLLSIWWFFCLILVAGGIIFAVILYYSAEVDVKDLESEILSQRITNCLVEDDSIIPNFLKEDFNIFNECGLVKELFNKQSKEDIVYFYFSISLNNSAGESLRKPIRQGNYAFEGDCDVQRDSEGEKLNAPNLAKCTYKTITLSSGSNLSLLTASNQKYRKVLN